MLMVMSVTPQLYEFTGSATDTADFLIRRDAVYIDGTPGFVNTALTVQDEVTAGGTAYEWTGLFQLINTAGKGQNVALYAQEVNTAPGATVFGQVVEARNGDQTNTSVQVAQEIDAVGHTAVGTDMIAFGQLDAGLRILPAVGGHITTGIAVNADFTVLDQNPADHFIYFDQPQNAGIALIGGHLVGVAQGHAAVIV